MCTLSRLTLQHFPHDSIAAILLLDGVQECPDLARRPQVMHSFRGSRFGNKLPVLGCHVTMAEGDNPVPGDRAPPHGTMFRPPLWSH